MKDALLKAIRKAPQWMGGAVIVRDGDRYDVIPGAFLTDISYLGSRDVVFSVADPSDLLGDDPSKYTDGELLDYIEELLSNLDDFRDYLSEYFPKA